MEYRIQWLADGVELPGITQGDRLERWLDAVAKAHGRILGQITYIFCADKKILQVNKEFLN
ncbi:MAG: rRNA maturation factor, partial [Paramuribaculum sp.]|nr:rRNA maturation factor [Paramuribaculum sp.]